MPENDDKKYVENIFGDIVETNEIVRQSQASINEELQDDINNLSLATSILASGSLANGVMKLPLSDLIIAGTPAWDKINLVPDTGVINAVSWSKYLLYTSSASW